MKAGRGGAQKPRGEKRNRERRGRREVGRVGEGHRKAMEDEEETEDKEGQNLWGSQQSVWRRAEKWFWLMGP